MGASVARAEGRRDDARAALRAVIDEGAAIGVAATEWTARYRLAQLERSDAARDEAAQWFRERGVQNPERWVSTRAPGLDWR